MLNRLTLRWRLTLLHTGVFLVVGALVVTMVYLQNRIVITKVGTMPPPEFTATQGGQPPPATASSSQLLDMISVQRNDAIGTILIQWIAALVVMTVIVGLLAWWVTGRVLNRVHIITSQARRISTANLHERIAVEGPDDELTELASTLDGLLSRLDRAFSAQARFIANASHELRTPLAVARTTLQVGLATTDPARVQHVRDELLLNNGRCIALINGLLTLARGEQERQRHEPVAFDSVVRTVIQESADRTATEPKLLIDVLEPCTVNGDPVLIAQLVRNLIDNAIRYNVPEGEVLARLQSNGHLTISNTGPVIDEEDTEHLFEPFYRGRGRTGRTDGAGLGLSIVRAVAASHGGQATARSLNGGGLAVEVHLPPRIATRSGATA